MSDPAWYFIGYAMGWILFGAWLGAKSREDIPAYWLIIAGFMVVRSLGELWRMMQS